MTCTLNLALQVDIQGADMYLVHITKNTEKKGIFMEGMEGMRKRGEYTKD